MKSIISAFIGFFFMILSNQGQSQSKNFLIKGEIEGAKDGMVVYLQIYNERKTYEDSTTIKDSRFTFSGHRNYPQLYNIIIHKNDTPHKPNYPLYQPVIPVFVENSDINVSAILDSIPQQDYAYYGSYNYNNVRIEGSLSNKTYRKFLNGYDPLAQARSSVFDAYIDYLNPPKGKKKGPVSEGIHLVTKMDEATRRRDAFVKEFIKENPTDYVSLFVAGDKLSAFSVKEIDEIINSLSPEIMNTKAGKVLKEKAEEVKKTAVGAMYADFSFKDNSDKPVNLSEYLGKGKYVLLEFWASWCGPCRADIPHLKEVYSLYHPAGFEVISISMDDDKAKWLKAIDEEKMAWLQVSDLKAFDGMLSKLYNFNGIPTCVLVGPDGKIITRNMRGSWMDKKLIELYGNKFQASNL